MNTSGEVADLMVKEGLQVTEEVVKLTGLGAKNLAAIIIALLKEDNKTQGKTNMKKLLQSNKPLCILQIKESDLKQFNREANKYGVLFTPVKDENNNTGLCDIIAKQDDVPQINRILEIMGYTKPEVEAEIELEESPTPEKAKEEPSKNAQPRMRENQQEKESSKCGVMEKEASPSNGKPSVKKKVEEIKEQQAKQRAEKAPEKIKTQQYSQPNVNKKKTQKKGKNR